MCILIIINAIVLQDITSEESTALSIVSYIGCAISIFCLLVTIVVLVFFRLVVIILGIYVLLYLFSGYLEKQCFKESTILFILI